MDKEKIFFTSDTHWSHGNILKYSNRPFMNEHEQGVVDWYKKSQSNKFGAFGVAGFVIEEEKAKAEEAYRQLRMSKETVERHDEALIANWNAKVPKDGIVYHLGDFCFNAEKGSKIVDRLNGQIFFILGNHDKPINQFKQKFGWVKDMYTVKVDDPEANRNKQEIVLCHYAMRVWNKSHHGAWNLYGHSHGSLPDDPNSLSFDCGVDCHDYAPLSYDDVKRIMRKKTWKSIDHHEK